MVEREDQKIPNMCESCIHLMVCAYRERYADIMQALSEVDIELNPPDGTKKSLKLDDIWFLKNIQINCKYYRNPYQIKERIERLERMSLVLKILIIYYLIGLLLTLRVSKSFIEKCSAFEAIGGVLIMGTVAPIILIRSFFQKVFEKKDEPNK